MVAVRRGCPGGEARRAGFCHLRPTWAPTGVSYGDSPGGRCPLTCLLPLGLQSCLQSRVGLCRKVPAFISHHTLIPCFLPRRHLSKPLAAGRAQTRPRPRVAALLRAVPWLERPRLFVSVSMCLISVFFSHAHPLCKGFAGAMLSLRGLRPTAPPSSPQVCDLALSAPLLGTSGHSFPASDPGALCPHFLEKIQAPHCRQNKAEVLGTRPLTHLCSWGLRPKAGNGGLCCVVFVCVYFYMYETGIFSNPIPSQAHTTHHSSPPLRSPPP